jgi:hypothetical protein
MNRALSPTERAAVEYRRDRDASESDSRGAMAKASDYGGHRVEFKSVDAFCREYTPISYAIEPFVRSASLYTLTAKTGAGKTALLIGMALAVATGRDNLLGREVTKGRVAYVAAENPDDLRMRIMVAAFLWNIDLAWSTTAS